MDEKQYLVDALSINESWRMFRIMSEFVDAIETLSQIKHAVSIFGSARTKPDDPYYRKAELLARRLVENGFGVITGGGPGIMEAANRGACDVGAKSIGLNIRLPMEQQPNPFVTPELCFQFHYFAMRKFHFMLRARGLVVFPGGFGTLDELFETLALRQTRRMQNIPIIVFGREYWNRVIDFQFLADEGVIDDDDLDLIRFAETPQEAWDMIVRFHQK